MADNQQSQETKTYLLRNVPADLWRTVRQRALDDDTTAREIVLRGIAEYVGWNEK